MNARLPLVLAAALLAVGTGCQDDWQSFFIQDNKLLSDSCEPPTDSSAPGLIAGRLDIAARTSYAGYLHVQNRLIARADPGLPRAESNGIFVQGAYLTFEGDACLGGFGASQEVRFSNFIEPQGSATIGIWLIPEAVGAAIRSAMEGGACAGNQAEITVTVQIFGVTQGGIDMETQEFSYPITVCYGCLGYCPPGVDLDPAAAGCQCDCNSETEQEDEPCHIGQDGLVDCRFLECS
jgi:hypothetical protein